MVIAQRICSLLPSATEIVCLLGLEDRLVAVTHECDYPTEAQSKPRVTSSVIDGEMLSARDIDQAVRDSLAEQATIYHLDGDLLDDLQPDLILTQELCEVCAVGPDEVRSVVASLRRPPMVVSLEPHTLDEVLESILLVGRLTGTSERALTIVTSLRSRIAAVQRAVAEVPIRRVLTLEWMDPVFVGGHWVPEMVALAGGQDVLGEAGQPSREVPWSEIVARQPETIIAMPCGFGLERSVCEVRSAGLRPEWAELAAVEQGEIYAVDGSSYFNRPGPRLIDGVEILATIMHPDVHTAAPPDSFQHLDGRALASLELKFS